MNAYWFYFIILIIFLVGYIVFLSQKINTLDDEARDRTLQLTSERLHNAGLRDQLNKAKIRIVPPPPAALGSIKRKGI